ncbi:DUF1566 domain-containing protein [Chromatium okenii]|uniref:Lcl C-terminal domain-containing protein n=1 Tax=Chromatium okenii TaxID=61644 RepID=UPI001904542B|nr:DUF1566 domain-containing protein [Chromatium okenii]
MPKIIKFDLPIDGIRAKNIEEIRDHFTLEILAHFRSGLLAKWLAVRKLNTELEALQAIDTSADDQTVFKRLCEIFTVENDDAVIAVLFNDPTPKISLTVAEIIKQSETADKIINLADLLPIKANELKLFMNRLLTVDELSLDRIDFILRSAHGTLIFKSCEGINEKQINGRYRDLGDGTVFDVHTRLHWMRCALGQIWTGNTCKGEAIEYNRDDAHNAVAELNKRGGYAGYCDWRLPSIDELKTLVYCSSGKPKMWNDTGKLCEGDYNKPTIDLTAFPNTPSSWFWSGSPYIENPYGAWSVFFSNGDAYYTISGAVRLVRGGQ